jgi:transcription antitermination factor NusA-like protein
MEGVGMPFELTREEKEMLVGLLEKEFGEIRTEVHHTQSHEYKESLKDREKRVQELLNKLKG